MNHVGSPQAMRLTFVIFSLSSGGAERVMSTMTNYWAAKNWPVTLLTFDDGREPPFYKLHEGVTHVTLGIAAPSANRFRGITSNLGRIRDLRRAIRSSGPDAVIAFMDKVNVLTLLATVGLNTPVVISERSDPHLTIIGAAWNRLRSCTYRRACRIVVQTEAAKAFFSESLQRRTRVIPNPVFLPPGAAAGGSRGVHKQIVGMGRLGREKGFDLLLEAFAQIASRHPDWSLVIWGEGQERGGLEQQRDRLGLRDRIRFPGRTHRPFEKFREADLFVLPSRFEGFPNALCEAMACGLPVVSFDCPSGPGDIIRHSVDGMLIPPGDVAALSTAMENLMEDEKERNRLARRAIEISARFNLEKVMNMWETLLHELNTYPDQ
jgi:GalNAc-alpha-(1->4)-GalNAc-alpha-(1->3)-diNAcBac-PP-undecaprenol alpha-1,4-N-acetyl-D-galactosaminyltransferase